ncbi:ExbD/TolR family protein [Parathalassolituus penaei]|uniref:Biopolymer transporter ExbD n=1 Tax=Parathalassolituus penaei TaxID=2997323 RepID=A0A9X3ITL0_9GAMM|nr:biopolymer transporter ExbD [Parathalassolituus penaei]MCY0966425.1 biopolymer transporter ExbD [Parathalassolituus penaei]
MNFKRQQREEVSVNMTPLIDIVFLLLIFFMVSTTFTKESHLNLDLPEATAQPSDAPERAIEIVVTAEGNYSINNQALINQQVDSLKRGISHELGERQTAPLVITADSRAPHGAVVRAMDAAGQLGLVNISITTRQSENEN